MMNVKKSYEMLDKLKQRNTQAQLQDFIKKKKEITGITQKSKYLDYLEQVMPALYHRQEQLQHILCIDMPRISEKPTLQGFFALFPEEQRLGLELSRDYAKMQGSSLNQLLIDCQQNPYQLIDSFRMFNTKEYHLLESLMGQMQSSAKKLSLQLQTLLASKIPITTATYQYFNKFDTQFVPAANQLENFQYQVANLCVLTENKQNYKAVDIYAEAFKLNPQELTNKVNNIKDKIRNNIQIQKLVESFQGMFIQLNQLLENELQDEQVEEAVHITSINMQRKLDKIVGEGFSTTQGSQNNTNNTKAPNLENFKATGLKKEEERMIRQRVKMQTEAEIAQLQLQLEGQMVAAEDQAQQAFRKQIIDKRDSLAQNKRKQQDEKNKLALQQQQARINAAERDAMKVRPNAPIDPGRLYRDTEVLKNRKTDTILRQEVQKQISRGQYDINYQGEQLKVTTNIGNNKAASFDIMCVLAEQGLLGTQSGREAVQMAQRAEMGQRFQSWALRDDVRGIF